MPNVHDYFQRSCQRGMEPLTGLPGEQCSDSDGNSARFWLATDGGRIVQARFKCTTCCTLVGLCEHAAELLAGMTVTDAEKCSARRLLVLHPEIPEMRHDRATLVADAIRSAALRAKMEAYA